MLSWVIIELLNRQEKDVDSEVEETFDETHTSFSPKACKKCKRNHILRRIEKV